jgi:hypothetical protein
MVSTTIGTHSEVRDWELWQHRYNGLANVMTALQGSVDDNVSRRQTFDVLLKKLGDFAKSQFDFLYNSLDPRPVGGPRLNGPAKYPSDLVMEATLDQIAYDLAVLQGAISQRRLAKKNSAVRSTLEIADRLAYCALLPALNADLLPFPADQVTVLTYFQKAPHIRMIPYAPVALVGIPFTTLAAYHDGGEPPAQVGNARDLLSIPHEIGHYVYQHGDWKSPSATNRSWPEWLPKWEEEIFADVYGLTIAGPVIVRDFQDIMRDNESDALVVDDGEHPSPVLRPLLYVDALMYLADRPGVGSSREALLAIAARAEAEWSDFRGRHGNDVQQQKQAAIIDKKRADVGKAVEIIFNFLTRGEPVPIDRLWSPAVQVLNEDDPYDALYQGFFNDIVTGELLGRLATSLASASPPEPEHDWQSPSEASEALQKVIKLRDELMAGSGRVSLSEEDWARVVSTDGWATDGPENNPEPKII